MSHAAPSAERFSEAQAILLPQPRMSGGLPLLDALHNRKTTREFAPRALTLDVMSELLWAANGYNRPETKHRTAPTARDRQEIAVYVALTSGVYVYDAAANQLHMVSDQDLRSATGEQDYVADAPVDLIYVADIPQTGDVADCREKTFYAGIDAGFVAQNVYLFCASQGLATVVRGLVPREQLAKTLGLGPNEHIIVAQSVGYPLN